LPDHLKYFQGHFVFQRDTARCSYERAQGVAETGICLPLEIRSKNQTFLEYMKSGS